MLKPLLIIGIGGSGGKTIRSMKQALNRQLASHRYEGGIPAAWQFLQIDTTYDGIDFPAPMLTQEEIHLVVPNGEDFYNVLNRLESLGAVNSEKQNLLTGWAIPNSNVSIQQGAGQMRGIGRQVGIADAPRIMSAIITSISKMKSATSLSELSRLADAIGSEGAVDEPRAILVASLAGGSGAGMFIDVAEILKRASTDSWTSEAIAMLYTSEVFESLGDAGADVRKNSLGAMNEIVSGKWGGLTDRSQSLLAKLSLPANSAGTDTTFGCKGNILIGARNNHGANIAQEKSGAGMDEVFLTVGEALAGMYTDDSILEFLYKRAFVNITERKMTVDASGLGPETAGLDTLPFAGMGFGRLTLGADRVVDYVADAMTNTQIKQLLWPELAFDLLKDGIKLKDLIDEKVDELWPQFRTNSGLDERGNEDQVLDELRAETLSSDLKKFTTEVIKSGISEKPVDVPAVARRIWGEWETRLDQTLDVQRSATKVKTLKWRGEIQTKVLDLVANAVSVHGYSVALGLLDKLEAEIRDHGCTSLKEEATTADKAIRNFDEQKWRTLVLDAASGRTGLSSNDNEVWLKLSKILEQAVNFKYEIYIKNLAASLLTDFLTGVLNPLRAALSAANYELSTDHKATQLADGQTNPVKWFPEWGSGNVPPRYQPRTIERTLIAPDQYEAVYNLEAGKEAGVPNPFNISSVKSLLGIRMDVMPGTENRQNLLELTDPWIPSVSEAQHTGEPGAKAKFALKSGILQLGERNRVWLKDPSSMFGRMSDMSIRTFVEADGDAKRSGERGEQFVTAYQAMLSLSQPLVKLNKDAMKYIVSVNNGEPADATMTETSKIPFAPDSKIGVKCVSILQGIGVKINDAGFHARWFDASSSEREMYAAATSQASLPAWAFESLTGPIAQQAAVAKASVGLWTQFWDGRRARPLVEAIPLSPEIRKSIVTGWFVARWFNMIEIEKLPVGMSAKIWNPTLSTPGVSQFPSPLLSGNLYDNKRSWLLPSLLASIGLATVEVGQTGRLDALHPYQLLKFIGREITTSVPSRDQWDGNGVGDKLPSGLVSQSSIIADWVTQGTAPSATTPIEQFTGQSSDTPQMRQHALVQAAERVQGEYAEVWTSLADRPWQELPHMWELKEDISTAMLDIRHYVQQLLADDNAAPLG
jgi:hypothetical protein